MLFRRIFPLILLAAPALAAAQNTDPAARPKPAQLPADSMQIGQKYTKWFYENQIDSLVAHMDSAGRAQPQARSQVQQSILQLASRAGEETTVIEEKFITRNGGRQYWRTAKFSNFGEPIVIRWAINAKGELIGFGMNPLSQVPAIDP